MKQAWEVAVLSYISQQKWAMSPDYIGLISAAAHLHYCGNDDGKEAAKSLISSLRRDDSDNKDIRAINGKNIQIIPISGAIRKRNSWLLELFGGTSTEKLQSTVQTFLEDGDADVAVLKVDSPGGTVDGVKEAADFIFQAQQVKPIVTYVDGLMASAGLYLGSPARKVTAYNTSEIGSIGVWTMHSDFSKAFEDMGIINTIIASAPYKGKPNPYEPLTKDIKNYVQDMIGGFSDIFIADVSRYMDTDINKVRSEWANGKMFLAEQAKEMGLIDEIMTFDETLEMAAEMVGGKTSVAVKATHINSSHDDDSANINSNKEDDMDLKALEEKMGKLAGRVDALEADNKTLMTSNDTLIEANKKLTASNEELTKANGKLSLKMTLAEEKDREAKEKNLADSIMDGILTDSNVPVKAHVQVKKLYGDYSKHVEDNGTFTAGSESEKAFTEAFKSEVASIEADFSSDSSIGASDPKDDLKGSVESDVSLAQELARSVSGKIRSDGN